MEIKISTGNAAFHAPEEYNYDKNLDMWTTARELEDIFHKICNDIRYRKQTEGVCMDSNGNKVGEWRLYNDI